MDPAHEADLVNALIPRRLYLHAVRRFTIEVPKRKLQLFSRRENGGYFSLSSAAVYGVAQHAWLLYICNGISSLTIWCNLRAIS
jgi:hypothetical protein